MPLPELKRVLRLDSLPLGQTFITEEGYLRDSPVVTRVGIFVYKNPDGSIRRELRLPEEVFDPESLASYKGKPVVLTHDAGLINKDNVAEHQVGTILSNGYRSGEEVKADIVIHNTPAMQECKLRELSLGYSLDLDETPGVWNGEPYDAIQRNIRINHLALVQEARAGDRARLNIDGCGPNNKEGGDRMKRTSSTRRDGILSAEELEAAIAEYKAAHGGGGDGEVGKKPDDAANPPAGGPAASAATEEKKDSEGPDPGAKPPAPSQEAATMEETVEEIRGRKANTDEDVRRLIDIIDTLLAEREFRAKQNKPDATDGEDGPVPTEKKGAGTEELTEMGGTPRPMNADAIDALVRDRIQVGLVGHALNLDGLEAMPLREARIAVVRAVRPEVRLDGKSDAFINAAFELACAEVKSRGGTDYQKRQMFNRVGAGRADSSDSAAGSAEAARERMIARQRTNKEGK